MRYVRISLILILMLAVAPAAHAAKVACAKCKKPIETGSYVEASGKFYHSNHFTCTRCSKPIGKGTYQLHDGQIYDSACYVGMFNPRCTFCGKAIAGKYITVETMQYHDTCYTEHVADRCALCGKPIQGAYLYDNYGQKVHADHLDDAKQCNYCSRLLSPATQGGETFTDGRVVCGLCLEAVVTDKREADSLVRLAREVLAREGIVIGLKKIPYEIVSRKKMATLSPTREKGMQGYTKLTQTQGLFGLIKDNDVKLYILEKMPKWNFLATAAHELMHVWLGLNGRFDTDDLLAEGSCNYAAFLVLKHFTGESDAVIGAMMTDPDPIYGEGFRQAKAYAESVGKEAWLTYLKTSNHPPW